MRIKQKQKREEEGIEEVQKKSGVAFSLIVLEFRKEKKWEKEDFFNF